MYDACSADGCGLIANSHDEWVAAIESLIADPEARRAQILRAQDRVRERYSLDRLREQVAGVLDLALAAPEARASVS